MNRSWKIAAAIMVIGGSLWVGSIISQHAEGASVSNQPGTVDDPVVTKSYVDQAIQKALQGAGGTANVNNNTSSTGSTGSTVTSTTSSSSEKINIVDVRPGEKLIAAAGAEFIVRSGKAVVYSRDKNGVADLTDGVDIINGGAVTNNHLLSFPRDGRGIQVLEGNKYNLIVMVRGQYQIVK